MTRLFITLSLIGGIFATTIQAQQIKWGLNTDVGIKGIYNQNAINTYFDQRLREEESLTELELQHRPGNFFGITGFISYTPIPTVTLHAGINIQREKNSLLFKQTNIIGSDSTQQLQQSQVWLYTININLPISIIHNFSIQDIKGYLRSGIIIQKPLTQSLSLKYKAREITQQGETLQEKSHYFPRRSTTALPDDLQFELGVGKRFPLAPHRQCFIELYYRRSLYSNYLKTSHFNTRKKNTIGPANILTQTKQNRINSLTQIQFNDWVTYYIGIKAGLIF